MTNERDKILTEAVNEADKKEIKALKGNPVNIRTARDMAGLTRGKLADYLNISEDYLKELETEPKNLKFDYAVRIAKWCNVSLDYIYGLSDLPNEQAILPLKLSEYISVTKESDVLKIRENGNWETTQKISLRMNEATLNFLINLEKVKYQIRKNEIEESKYDFLKAQLELEYAKELEINKSMTKRYILCDPDNITEALESSTYISQPTKLINTVNVGGEEVRITKENLLKSIKEKRK